MQAAPNLFEPSSRDPRERDQWLRYTKRSLEFAAQLGAGVLVCHLGSVGFFWFDPAVRLRAYLDRHAGLAGFARADFPERLKRTMSRIRERMPLYWENLVASLREIDAFAREKDVRLGFENREKVEELPLDDEFETLFKAMGPTTQGGYWHDTGHAELKRRHGLLDHRQQLAANASRSIGFHLHDVDTDGEDHQPVGTGCVDFEMVSEFWQPQHLLVLELGPRATEEDVLLSKQRIEALLAARGF